MLVSNFIVSLFLLAFCHSASVLTDNVASAVDDNESNFLVEYSAEMMSFMNRTVAPCDDFYEYACGNWVNVIKPRQTEHKRSNALDIIYKLADIIADILQKPNIDDVDPEYEDEFQMAIKFYQNCLETNLTTMHKSSEYLDVIQEIGGFPALDSQWDASRFSWINMSAHMSNYGVENLIVEQIANYYPFSPNFVLPSFGFEIELHHDSVENISSNAYLINRRHMHDILLVYGVREEDTDPIIRDIFDFLKAVLKVFNQFNDDHNKCKSLTTSIDDATAMKDVKLKWNSYYAISWIDKDYFSTHSGEPCWFLYYQLDKICEQHKTAVANYLSLKFLYHMEAHLKDETMHKDYCIARIRQGMVYLFDHLYMKMYFSNETKNEVTLMIKELRKSLRSIIEKSEWLDEETRKAALSKESKIIEYVGKYEDVDMQRRLLAELKHLKFDAGNYDANNLNLKKFEQSMTRFNGLHYKEITNDTKPLILLIAMQVQAFYYIPDNSIYVMAGAFHPPHYHKEWPKALMYGTIGWTLAHELIHMFDMIGRNYDHTGSYNNGWSEKSEKLFVERAACFVEKFANYHIPEINRNINGVLTQNENIADAGAIHVALTSWHRYIKEEVGNHSKSASALYKENQMPGLDLSPEQLLFLGHAQMFCSLYEEADYWEELKDGHVIDKYRLWGIVTNSVDFAEAFKCPLGSKMNPVTDKCALW